MSDHELASVRTQMGMVFQSFNLWPHFTVLQNVIECPVHVLGVSKDDAVVRGEHLLEKVGLEAKRDAYPYSLSGGQKQRVAIARSIAKSPKLLLGDELTGNLDSGTSAKVMEALTQACKSENITTIMVTHDESLAKYATRAIHLDSGKVKSDEQVV